MSVNVNIIIRSWTVLLSSIAFFLAVNLAAESQTIEAIKFHTSPAIDGKLDDECWQRVTGIDAFKIAELETTVPNRTEVFLGFDDEALYVSFRCVQKEASIIANQTRRDGSFQYEDHVAVYLDTHHDRRRSYCFAVSPLGIQRDEKQDDLGWDGEWFAAAIVEPSVWTVEMKIPFEMLDLPQSAKQTWGLNLVRRHQSLDRTSIWADTGVNVSDANQFGTLTNLEFNPKDAGRKFQLGGYFSGKAEDFSTTEDLSTRFAAAIGGDVVYKLTTSTSFIGTVNPDFSHIESEVQGIVLSDLEQRLTDRRPFFQEDGRIFRAPIALFYSRRIGEMAYGAKLIGKTGKATYGLMNVKEKNDESHNVLLRGLWDAGNASSFGLFFASKEIPGTYNRSVAFDGSIRLPRALNFVTSYAGNWEPHKENTRAFIAEVKRKGNPILSLAYRDFSGGFNPVNGYVRLTDVRQPSFWGVYQWPVEKGFLRAIKFESVQSVTWDQAGEKTRGHHFQLIGFDLGEKIETGFFYRNWSYDIYSNWVVAAQTTYNRQRPDRIFVVYQHGEFEGATATFVTTAMNLIPFRFLSLGIEGENLWQTFPDGHKTRNFSLRASMNLEIGAERWVTVRLRSARKHKPNFNAVFKYTFVENLVLYIVYGDQHAEATINQLFTKIAFSW
ncbi:MAG: DUF5916 domain-containing protein [Candidatus Poribacteria bacterium]|nr:DUF5916 domain-containing protein [Candidatus Poribacteria bacterium]